MNYRFIFLIPLLYLAACESNSDNQTTAPKAVAIEVPVFNADSAYHYVEMQVAFGPRVPNTEPHVLCGNWLEEKLAGWADRVVTQENIVKAHDDLELKFKNIIASYNPKSKKRVLLCAHWDTRPYADQEPLSENRNTPIDGANDGGSGVGVLLEIARQLKISPVKMGVDIILFDVEDYGQPNFSTGPRKQDTYCLGSQYWGSNPHQPGYSAKYGILLDMVGAPNSTFLQEEYSLKFAPSVVKKVWNTAAQSGYSDYFLYKKSKGPVLDDHYYINTLVGIPTIDIINLDNNNRNMFGHTWHTLDDNMDNIDTKTLKAVGQTLLEVLYRENAGAL